MFLCFCTQHIFHFFSIKCPALQSSFIGISTSFKSWKSVTIEICTMLNSKFLRNSTKFFFWWTFIAVNVQQSLQGIVIRLFPEWKKETMNLVAGRFLVRFLASNPKTKSGKTRLRLLMAMWCFWPWWRTVCPLTVSVFENFLTPSYTFLVSISPQFNIWVRYFATESWLPLAT